MEKRKSRKVVVVENDSSRRAQLSQYFGRMGFNEVVAVADGRSAMTQLRQTRPDLVCLDLLLPDTSGYELCEDIRRTPGLDGVPVLMMSPRTLPEDLACAEELGANVLARPFKREELERMVSRIIDAPPADPVEG